MNVIQKFTTRVSKYGFEYVMKVILKNKVYRHIDHIYMAIGKVLWKNAKLTDTIILESHNDFDCNGGAFYDYLIREGYNKKYKIVWMLQNKKPKQLPDNVICFNLFRPSFRKTYYFYTAKYMTSDHHILGRKRNGQTACYLDHGTIGLKAFKGMITLPDELDCILVPSKYLAPILADQYNLPYPNNKQRVLGYPFHDIFYSDRPGDLGKLTHKKYQKVILWMPTFRKSVDFNRIDSDNELPLGIPIIKDIESCKKLNDFLRLNNAFLIVKIHPMQDLTTVKIRDMSNILVLDANTVKQRGVDNYRLMKDVDALISDYSSAAYDFMHADKPIAFTLDDAEDYKLGFLFENPLNYMPGHIVYNQEEFMGFIQDVIEGKDPYKSERERISNLFYAYHDENGSRRLAEYMGLTKV